MNPVKKTVSRSMLAGLLFLALASGLYAQNGRLGRIAILPFSGGTQGEREGIPELFMTTSEMLDNFMLIPRTSITTAVQQEQSFQSTSGMTNADTIARLGIQFGADYVMAGSITSLGSKNLLIVSIVRIDVIRQVAGVYLTYDSMDELDNDESIRNKMAEELVDMAWNAADGLDKLALLPVAFEGDTNKQEGDALAQILAIHLLRAGKYAVYPRTKSLEQVQGEYDTQLKGGVTRTDEAVKAGEAENPSYALSVISRKIGTGTRFNASIIDLEGGYTVMATSEQYANMSDGMYAMEFLARKLSGEEISKEERENRMRTIRTEISGAVRTVESAERARARAEATDKFLKSSGIAFSGWGGFGLVGTAVKRVKSNDGTGNLTINDVKYKQDIGAYGGAGIELRMYRYFGIQTGIIAVTDYAPYTPSGGEEQYAKLSFVQIPILARFNFNISDFLGEAVADDSMGLPISVFGGLGINAGVKVSNADSADPGKLGLIAGLEMGLSGRSFGVFTGYQYNGGLGSGSLTLNGASYGYTRNNHLIYFGAKYYLPFRK